MPTPAGYARCMEDVSALRFRRSIARESADCYVISLGGEIDLYVAPLVADAFETVAGHGAVCVVLDLGEAEFVDSTLLGLLTREVRRLRGVNGRLVIVCDDPRILRPFQLTGLDKLVPVTPTLAEALAAFGGAADENGRGFSAHLA
jgi:anti-sigma B factor antagonist